MTDLRVFVSDVALRRVFPGWRTGALWHPGDLVDHDELIAIPQHGTNVAVSKLLPGEWFRHPEALLDRVAELEKALEEACDGWSGRDADNFDTEEIDALRAVAVPR